MQKLRPLVIDTNILLDCFVFAEGSTARLHALLIEPGLNWVATPAMEEEFLRVLGYKRVQRWTMQWCEADLVQLKQVFEKYAVEVESASVTNVVCKDPDDQKFIDLAVAHQSVLLSKDKAVLTLRPKLMQLGVAVSVNEFPFTC